MGSEKEAARQEAVSANSMRHSYYSGRQKLIRLSFLVKPRQASVNVAQHRVLVTGSLAFNDSELLRALD